MHYRVASTRFAAKFKRAAGILKVRHLDPQSDRPTFKHNRPYPSDIFQSQANSAIRLAERLRDRLAHQLNHHHRGQNRAAHDNMVRKEELAAG